MRKSKIITIEGVGEITVKEVSPFALYQAMNAKDPVTDMLALADNCIDLKRDKLYSLYASELEQLVDAFLEVNSSFLAIAAKLGVKDMLTEMLAGMLTEVGKTLPQLFVNSYKEVMARLPGITAVAAS